MEFITEKEKSLQEYLPELTKEPDFDTFWTDTLTEAREHCRLPAETAICATFGGQCVT